MRYVLVPFDVPSGVRQLEVRYSYSDRIDSDPLVGGGNTLDIGLFDPRGTATGSIGFRGWSGSHKDAFVVGEDWATPPYAAGPDAGRNLARAARSVQGRAARVRVPGGDPSGPGARRAGS